MCITVYTHINTHRVITCTLFVTVGRTEGRYRVAKMHRMT